jgi:triacylglycerol lipase
MAEYTHFATIAQIAYLDNAKKQFKKLGYNESHLIDVDGAQAHIAANEERIIIAFRGTEPTEWNDIKADLNAFHEDGFHKGFLHEFKKLQPAIQDRLEKLASKHEKPRQLFITGHSLGGAMATVAAFYYPEAEYVYTFGAPRACGWKRSKVFPVPHIRVVNNNDVVPKVPFAWLGFKHTGELHYMNFYGNVRKMTKWQRFKDGWRGRWRALKKRVPFDGFYDHSMNEYCRFLKDDG